MSQAIIAEQTKKYFKQVPSLKSGYTVRVHQKIKEGEKERVQIFEGLIIKINGEGVGKTITVRKISEGVGVEKVFPIHSPNITKIEVKKIAKVRRSKLYYMRDLSGKSARLREQHITQAQQEALNQHNNVAETEIKEEKIDTPTEQTEEQTTIKESTEPKVKEEVKTETSSNKETKQEAATTEDSIPKEEKVEAESKEEDAPTKKETEEVNETKKTDEDKKSTENEA